MLRTQFQKNISLRDKNTLNLDVSTKYYIEIDNISELLEIICSDVLDNYKVFILGGGSNVLFSKNFQGLVLKANIKGVNVVYEDDESVHIRVGAGEDWPSLVEYSVNKGWGGIENLALVPGTAGAAPVQNIACYGHSLHESLLSVEAIDLFDKSPKIFSVDECDLGYRTSIFKTKLNGQTVITHILLKLQKKPTLNTSYKSRYESVENELSLLATPPYSVKDVYNAIISIRRKKLPDVGSVGTVGSVFKNPLITMKKFKSVRDKCPGIHYYPKVHLSYDIEKDGIYSEAEMVKIPAAWLIDEMGWAGKRVGNCGIWKTQPLNLINYGNATPAEYLSFIKMVKDAVWDKYSIDLETEVVIV